MRYFPCHVRDRRYPLILVILLKQAVRPHFGPTNLQSARPPSRSGKEITAPLLEVWNTVARPYRAAKFNTGLKAKHMSNVPRLLNYFSLAPLQNEHPVLSRCSTAAGNIGKTCLRSKCFRQNVSSTSSFCLGLTVQNFTRYKGTKTRNTGTPPEHPSKS